MNKAKTTTKAATPARAKKTTPNAPVAHGVGRRKKAVARVWLKKGNGVVTVNGRDLDTYFNTVLTRAAAVIPFTIFTEAASKFDAQVNVSGGGHCAQADAIKLGISRALVSFDETMRIALRKNNLLTVDQRQKERKKYGQKAARRKFQFVKR